MSKTTPVRWWRSDEDRYKSRGAYMAPKQPSPAATQWAIELLAEVHGRSIRDVSAMIEQMNLQMAREVLPANLWNSMCAPPDPLADIKHEMQRLTRLADDIGRPNIEQVREMVDEP